MINKTQEVREDEDDSYHGQSAKEKSANQTQNTLINIKNNLLLSGKKVWKWTVTWRSSRFC